MCEMISPPSTLIGGGLDGITDGLFSDGTYGMVVGYVAPEAYTAAAIALVREGDTIIIDAPAFCSSMCQMRSSLAVVQCGNNRNIRDVA